MSDTTERRVDQDSRDRVVKIETIIESIHQDFSRMHADINRMSDSFAKHTDSNNQSFSDVNTALVKLTANMEILGATVKDQKDMAKSMIDTQSKLFAQFQKIDSHNKEIEEVKDEQKAIKLELAELKTMEARIQGSWKTLTIVASVIAFLVSTAISVGAFQMGKSSSTKTSAIVSQGYYA